MPDKLEFTSTSTPQPSAAQVYDDLVELSKKTEKSRESILMKGYTTVIISLGAVIALLAVAVVVMAIGWSREQGTIVPQIETIQVEKEIVVEVPAFTVLSPSEEFNHALADERYMLNDSNYGPIWMPILESVARNEYDTELFVKDEETGYMSYSGDVDTIAGIDVAKYQGTIDWKKVKDAGFEFVIIRCGNRGYVTGSVVEDDNFKQNIKGALDAGLQVGVYFFSQALNMEEALDEANFIINLIDGYDITFPVFYDWEVVIDPDGDTARTAYIHPDDLTNNFLVFAERLELEGYTPAIYANKKTAVWKYDLSRVADYDIWYAEYNDTPSLPYHFEMWQYTSHGSVPGIKGEVDLNICFKDYGE